MAAMFLRVLIVGMTFICVAATGRDVEVIGQFKYRFSEDRFIEFYQCLGRYSYCYARSNHYLFSGSLYDFHNVSSLDYDHPKEVLSETRIYYCSTDTVEIRCSLANVFPCGHRNKVISQRFRFYNASLDGKRVALLNNGFRIVMEDDDRFDIYGPEKCYTRSSTSITTEVGAFIGITFSFLLLVIGLVLCALFWTTEVQHRSCLVGNVPVSGSPEIVEDLD